MATPTPLRRMAYGAGHVNVSKRRAAEDAIAMPPPPPPGTTSRRSLANRKRVLEEEDYVDALDEIIGRDFFPELPVLQRRMRWLQSNLPLNSASPTATSATPAGGETGRHDGQGNRATLAAQVATPMSDWGDADARATPHRQGNNGGGNGGSSAVLMETKGSPALKAAAGAASGAEGVAAPAMTELSLTDFLRRHTSEDHDSFQSVLKSDQSDHRRRYFWAFDGGVGSVAGAGGVAAPQLLLLKDGRVMSAARRAAADAACDPEAMIGDDRQAAPATWRHRVRNQLMFLPDMQMSREICGLEATATGTAGSGAVALLVDGSSAPGGPPVAADAVAAAVVGADGSGGGVVQHHATRFPAQESRARGAAAYEPPDSERSSVASLLGDMAGAGGGRSDSGLYASRNQRPVAMTPSPMPGAAAESPFVTWGDIAGTPLILDPSATPLPLSAALAAAGGPDGPKQFRINEQPRREALAHRLEEMARKKRKGQPTVASTQAAAAAATAPGRTLRSAQPLTPAALAFAARLAKGQPRDTPFGGLMTDRSRSGSGATPRREAAGGAAAAGRGVPTPLPSPGMRSRATAETGAAGEAQRGEAAAAASSRVTDGLLNL